KRLWQAVGAEVRAAAAVWPRLKEASRQTASDPARLEEARRLFVGESAARHRALSDAIEKEWGFNTALAGQLAREGRETYPPALWQIALLAMGALVLGIAAAVLVARSVARPIGQAVAIAENVAAGRLGQHIEAPGRDEAAQLLRALGHMDDSLMRIVGQV